MPPSARFGIAERTTGRAEVSGHGQLGGDRALVAAQPGDKGAQFSLGASGGYPFLQIPAAPGAARVIRPIGIRHDPRTAAPATRAVPGAAESLHRLADEDLDGVRAFGGFGQIPHAKVTLQLHRIEVANRTGHGDFSFKRTGWGSSSRPGAHLSEAVS